MADEQEQAPQMETGEEPVVNISEEGIAEVQDRPEQQEGGGDPSPAAHWCYQCNKEVAVEPEQGGAPGSMVCTECQSGFIEALVTAQTVRDVRRAQRRRRYRRVVEHMHPQQLMQVLQMLGQATNGSDSPIPGALDEESAPTGQAGHSTEIQTGSHEENSAATTANDADGQAPAEPSGDVQQELGLDGRVERPGDEVMTENPTATDENLDLERLAQEGHIVFIGGASRGHDDDSDEDLVISDTESEDAGDSADEDEEQWEEVEEDEEAPAAGEEGVAADQEPEAEPQEGEQQQPAEAEQPQQDGERQPRRRRRNMEQNLQQFLQELQQNLLGQNVEVRVELRNTPLYGNPGDYVDARGFEQILQQMFENDNTRKGAPPAAKSAIDCLVSVPIEQHHIDDGSAVCAICKDVVALGEPAKQMPCSHLYHGDCILLWLSSRNSCPVCRYEMPTDDPDYEEQKKNRSGSQQDTMSSQSPADSGADIVVDGEERNETAGNVADNPQDDS